MLDLLPPRTCAARPVDVRIHILRGFALHDHLDLGDIQPARRHVRRYECFEGPVPEPL